MRADRSARLERRKSIATGMLVFAALLLAACMWARHVHPHWIFDLLAAMAEAALVGGLADWFAVVALFRHPLGQRWIPHTAIIPSKKNALGANLADFLVRHFLSREQLASRLRAFDIAGRLATSLSTPRTAEKLGDALTRAMPHLVALVDSEQLHLFLHRLVDARLRQVDLSGLTAFGLRQLTASGRHEQLVDAFLDYLRGVLAAPETHGRLAALAGREVWRILRLVRLDRVVADKVARKLVDGATTLVAEMAGDPQHEMRLRLAAQLEALILRLEEDPALRARIDQFRDQLLEQAELAAYLRSLWTDLIAWLQADVRREDSAVRARIAGAAQAFGEGLAADADTRAWLNGWIQDACEPLIDRYRVAIRVFIVERIEEWSAEELTRELELSIGTDLQYIRYNGTAVGALIGGAIYGIGQVAHALLR
ncbi:MAG: DUF445 domain-containing protein [Lysobacter sp.]|nr:DUF445 domain-containing protein [Lysobacter sp.]